MSNVTYHKGGVVVDMEQVRAVVTPEPNNKWYPIPHSRLIEATKSLLTDTGLVVKNEQHILNKDGNQYFGVFDLTTRRDSGDWGLSIGLRNSHDKAFSAGLACGSRVFVCDNLAFSGEVTLARKHTRWIMQDLGGLILRAIQRLNVLHGVQHDRVELYKNTLLSDVQVHDVLVRSVKNDILPVTKLPAVLQEWETPSYGSYDHSLWRLQQAYTEVQKNTSVFNLAPVQSKMFGLFDTVAGFIGEKVHLNSSSSAQEEVLVTEKASIESATV